MSSKDFNMLEKSSMASGGRGKFSIDFKAQGKATSAEKYPLQKGFSLTYANQEEKASLKSLILLELLKNFRHGF